MLPLVIRKLQAIAKLNNDEFSYQIRISPTQQDCFALIVLETADKHDIWGHAGRTIDEVFQHENQSLRETCEYFGYKCPDLERII